MYAVINVNWTCTIQAGKIGGMTTTLSLSGLYVPLITPFTIDGALAEKALEQLARQVLDQGAAGIVALGTTAEAAALTEAERAAVLDICAAACAERSAILIAGAGCNDTARSARALAGLSKWPEVSAALTVVPYYNRPGEAGVLEHFTALAAASPVPLIIYNVPYRTGQPVGWPTLRQLADLPGVAGIKHAAGCIDADTVALMAAQLPGFAVLAGDDLYAPALLALGAPGAILASAHVATGEFTRLVSAWRQGQVAEARQVGHRLAELSRALFAEPNPAVIKGVLHELGLIPSPAVRLPLLPAQPESVKAALAAAVVAGAALAGPSRLGPWESSRS